MLQICLIGFYKLEVDDAVCGFPDVVLENSGIFEICVLEEFFTLHLDF